MTIIATGKATSFIDFTRASNATVTDSDGRVKWAPSNLLTNSESFDAAAWAKENTTVDANVSSAPNGTSTAELLKNTTASGVHGTYFTFAGLDASNGLKLNCFVKKNTVRYVALGMWNASGTAECGAGFDLDTGTVTGTGAVGSGYSASNASITSVGSSWYLISVTVVTPVTSNYATIINRSTSYSSGRISEVYTGATSESTYIWGAHLYRSDLGGMQANTSAYPMYNPTTPKNLLGYTEDFSNAAWTNSATTITTSATTAPNGLSTANKIVALATLAFHARYTTITLGSAIYTLSIYAKAAEYSLLHIGDRVGATYGAAFDLVSGTVVAGTTGGAKYVSSAITSVGNGWYRCSIVLSNPAASVGPTFVGYPSSGATVNNIGAQYTGDGTSGIYLWGAQLSDSASLDSYVPVYGAAVTSAAYYGPRRDFDPVTLACKGLLVEEQRANLMTYSDNFGSTGFPTATNIVVAENDTATTSPDGTTNADKLTDNTTNDQHRLFDNYTFTAANAHTLSVYVKRDTHRWFRMLMSDGTTLFHANFDLLSGVVGQKAASVTSSNIMPLSNGWFRVSMTFTVVAALGNIQMVMLNSDSTSSAVSYAGTGTSLWLYGLQIEANASFATSYIPTGAATATRNADVASVSTQAFPYSATEGTLVANVVSQTNGAYSAHLSDGTANNYYTIRNGSSGTAAVAASGGALQANFGSGALTGKTAAVYKLDDYAVSVGGGAVATDTSAAVPSGVTQLRLGAAQDGGANICGWIQQITYLPRRVSNAELVTRST